MMKGEFLDAFGAFGDGGEDGDELVGFVLERGEFFGRDDFCLDEQF